MEDVRADAAAAREAAAAAAALDARGFEGRLHDAEAEAAARRDSTPLPEGDDEAPGTGAAAFAAGGAPGSAAAAAAAGGTPWAAAAQGGGVGEGRRKPFETGG